MDIFWNYIWDYNLSSFYFHLKFLNICRTSILIPFANWRGTFYTMKRQWNILISGLCLDDVVRTKC